MCRLHLPSFDLLSYLVIVVSVLVLLYIHFESVHAHGLLVGY